MAEVLINNSYINEKTYVSPSNNGKIKISYILEIASTHDDNYNTKGFSHKNMYTIDTSIIVQNVK